MKTELKEFFTPPFVKSKGKSDGVELIMQKSPKRRGGNSKRTRLLNIVRDNIYWLFCDDDGAKTYNQIIDWVVAALNEKYEQDFGERKRWIIANVNIAGHIYPWACPHCEYVQDNLSNCCPHCGKPLDPQPLDMPGEEEKDEDRT